MGVAVRLVARGAAALGGATRALAGRPGGRALLAASLALVLAAACQPSAPSRLFGTGPQPARTPAAVQHVPASGPVAEVSGRLLYVMAGSFWSLDLRTLSSEHVARFPPPAFAGTLAASPDGQLVAFSLYRPGHDGRAMGGTDLYVMSARGDDARPILAYESPGVALGEPAWLPDGRTVYFTRQAPDGAPRIERVALDGSERQIVVANGHSPSVSPDGRRVAYLTTDSRTYSQALWVAGTDGAEPRRLLGDPEFQYLVRPTLSPDGWWIAFGAAGGPETPPPGSARRPAARLLAWLTPAVAYAHGVPWEVWVVGADGSGLRRLTDIAEDAPAPAWSPDGRWIAFAGELGVYLVRADGRELQQLTRDFADGGLTWLPR